jgi:hypothetical protein
MRWAWFAILLSAACGGGGGTPDVDAAPDVCSLPMTGTDAGDMAALKAERCNVPGSMGARKWYRVSATLPGGMPDIVQVDLWPNLGTFAAGPVAIGMYTISGPDLDFATCGVCIRAMGDKGLPTQKEYFATAGSVNVTALGASGEPISVTVSDAAFIEVDAMHKPVTGGCTATIPHAQIDGTVMDVGGTGGGGGGGGGGGSGQCPTVVGD